MLGQYTSIHVPWIISFRVTAEQIYALPRIPLPLLTTYGGPLELFHKLSVAGSLTSLRYLAFRSLSLKWAHNSPALLNNLRELAHSAPNLEVKIDSQI